MLSTQISPINHDSEESRMLFSSNVDKQVSDALVTANMEHSTMEFDTAMEVDTAMDSPPITGSTNVDTSTVDYFSM